MMQKKKNKKDGYSTNQIVFLSLIVAIALMLFLGDQLKKFELGIKNPYAKKIYSALVVPIYDMGQYLHLSEILPSARKKFLHITGLDAYPEWDSLFYIDDTEKGFDVLEQGKGDSSFKKKKEEPEVRAEPEHVLIEKKTYKKSDETNKVLNDREASAKKETITSEAQPLKKTPPKSSSKKDKVLHGESDILPRVLFFGDSQMFSLVAGVTRIPEISSKMTMHDIVVHSSGFVRSDYYNWPKKLEALFEKDTTKNEHFDSAIMLLGMNDYQNFYIKGVLIERRTPEWEEVYRKMIKRHIDLVLTHVPHLYWLGMPVVRQKKYNSDLVYINKIQERLAKEYSDETVTWISLRDIIPGPSSSYTDSITLSDNSRISVMKSDGIHYTVSGGQYIMEQILLQLEQ